MSFNSFCMSKIPVDMYIVGERLNHYFYVCDRPDVYPKDINDLKISKEDPESHFKMLNFSFIILNYILNIIS